MKSAKEDILGKIRSALAGSTKPPIADDAIERNYRQHGILSVPDKLALFEDRLRDYGCNVRTCAEGQIAALVTQTLSEQNKQGFIVPVGLPEAWLPSEFAFRKDDNISYHELDECDGVLTGCALAIAETGTIVLRHSAQEGRRALTLLPDYHLCVVFATQVVESVVEGFRDMNEFSRAPITTISGPSATSDIEMIRVQGVHGPRTLEVILVDDVERSSEAL